MRGESRIIIGYIAGTVLLMGLEFMFTALVDGVPMPPETHGQLVYEMPAELWSGIYILFSSLVLIGVKRNSRLLIGTGAFIGMLVNALFSMAADTAEFGYLLEKGSFIYALGWAGLAAWMWLCGGEDNG